MLVHAPPQAVSPPAQLQVPLVSQTPPAGVVHAPEVCGAALHTVVVPVGAQTAVPVCWQPPVPAEVHAAPVATHVPPQFDCPVAHPQLPVGAHTPPTGLVHAPDVRGVAPHTVVVPVGAQTTVPVCAQPPVPSEVQAAPVATHVPPQLECPAAQPQLPVGSQTPLTTPTQTPDVRGVALHTVVVPVGAQTTVPICAQPPVPAEVQAAPAALHVPPQLESPATQPQVPVESQTPPVGLVHAPEMRGRALHTVPVPVGAHTRVPACWQPPVPADVQAPPVGVHTPPQ